MHMDLASRGMRRDANPTPQISIMIRMIIFILLFYMNCIKKLLFQNQI